MRLVWFGRLCVCRGEEGATDQLGALARLRGASGVAAAGGQPRRLLPPRPQRAGEPLSLKPTRAMIHHSWWLFEFFLFMCHGILKCFLVGNFCFDAMHKNILILNDGPSGVMTDDRPRLVSVEF